MTKEDLIAQARVLDDGHLTLALELGEDGVLAALETIYGHGLADEQCGNVDEYGWHVYRVDRWLVETNDRGDHEVTEYPSEIAAENAFLAQAREEEVEA